MKRSSTNDSGRRAARARVLPARIPRLLLPTRRARRQARTSRRHWCHLLSPKFLVPLLSWRAAALAAALAAAFLLTPPTPTCRTRRATPQLLSVTRTARRVSSATRRWWSPCRSSSRSAARRCTPPNTHMLPSCTPLGGHVVGCVPCVSCESPSNPSPLIVVHPGQPLAVFHVPW